MRRIYYAYLLSVVMHPAFVHGTALAVAAALLARAVSLPDIALNFAATPVGQVPNFLWSSLTGTETFVLVLLGSIVFVLLSFSFTFKYRRSPHLQTA